jgi:hypothetical protein
MLPGNHWLNVLGLSAMALCLLTTNPSSPPKSIINSAASWQDFREDAGEYIAAVGWETASAYGGSALRSDPRNGLPPDWWD